VRVALVVNLVTTDRELNLATIIEMTHEAACAGAELVVFGEMAATGMINNDNPSHDLPLGETIPGPTTNRLSALAKELGIWLAIGLLEREEGRLYDSAVLLSRAGEIALLYRRNQPQWHGRNADPDVYCQGTDIHKVDTENGSFAFLICGDLWDDALSRRVRHLQPDWLLYLFARCSPNDSCDQAWWDRDEMPQYGRRVGAVGVPTLATSYISGEGLGVEGKAFGGLQYEGEDVFLVVA